MSFLPGHVYVLVKYLPTPQLLTSKRVCPDCAVALVSDLVILSALTKLENELAVTQRSCRQNHESVAEVRALGQPKSIRMLTVLVPYSDLIARLASTKSRSFSN